jgi:ABC-2 type transport system ATP-binding protein
MIVADGLTKYYGLKPAIQEVSFRIERGEIVGLLGPNGAGKTTILRILTCFMPPTQGSAKIDGLDTRTQGLKVRQKIGFLPENVPLYEELRVRFFLSFAGAAKGLRGQSLRKEVDRVIQDCGLGEHGTRLIKHLSKGLKQRVGLAQALLGNPPILILDEPTTGLDPAQIIEIRQLI